MSEAFDQYRGRLEKLMEDPAANSSAISALFVESQRGLSEGENSLLFGRYDELMKAHLRRPQGVSTSA